MIKTLFVLTLACTTLWGKTFHEAFMDEVVALSEGNPIEIVQEEREFLERFRKEPLQERWETDVKVRPIFVSAQGDFEKGMAYFLEEEKILNLIGVIHTPTPATPLCTEEEITPQLVDTSLEGDKKRLFTVMSRATIIREFLAKGGKLFAVYPEEGRAKRTEAQLAIFDAAKEAYPKNLIDCPISCEKLDPEMVGATYLFQTEEGWFAFAIMATQANAPEDCRRWAMWFGPLSDPAIAERVSAVSTYFSLNLPTFMTSSVE